MKKGKFTEHQIAGNSFIPCSIDMIFGMQLLNLLK